MCQKCKQPNWLIRESVEEAAASLPGFSTALPVSGNQSARVIRPRKRATKQQAVHGGGEPLPCRCRGADGEARSVAFREV